MIVTQEKFNTLRRNYLASGKGGMKENKRVAKLDVQIKKKRTIHNSDNLFADYERKLCQDPWMKEKSSIFNLRLLKVLIP